MSVHKSLKVRGKLARMRNVLTRSERIASLEGRRVWQEGDPVYGLPKTKVTKVKKGGKKKNLHFYAVAPQVKVASASTDENYPGVLLHRTLA